MKNRACASNGSLKMKQPLVSKVYSTIVKASSLTAVSGFLFLRDAELLSDTLRANVC